MNGVKHLDFMNKRLREKNEARTYISNFDGAMLEHYRVFAKKKLNLHHLTLNYQIFVIRQRIKKMVNGELLFAVVGTGITTYSLYKYLK